MKPVVGIIGGKGKMGKLFNDFFKKNGFKTIITDKKTKLSSKKLVEKSDVVVLSVPMNQFEKVAENIKFAKKEALIIDLCSLKETPLKIMQKYNKNNATIIGLHPLFGSRINSFKEKKIVIIPIKKNKWFHWLKKLFKKNKVKTIETDSKNHDKVMSIVQGLNYFIALNEAIVLKTSFEKTSSLSTPFFEKRKTSFEELKNKQELIKDILFLNKFNLKIMKKFVKTTEEFLKIIEEKNEEKFQKILEA